MNLKLSPKGKKYAADMYGLWLLQSTCGWLSASHHLTQPSEYLFIYLFALLPVGGVPDGRGLTEPFQEFCSEKGFTFPTSADVIEELEGYS